jgi:hypothetical protein
VGYATTTMKKNGLEPCGWIKIIEEEPTVHMPLSGQVCLHLQKAPLTAPASLEMLKKSVFRKTAKISGIENVYPRRERRL